MKNGPILMHAGTSPLVSQTVLTVMFVVLAIILVGVRFVFPRRSDEAIRRHRRTLTLAVATTLTVILLVMLPTTFNFYTDSGVELFSSLSILTITHGILGIPAMVTGTIYVFNDLPKNVKRWMLISAAFWISTLLVGVVMFKLMTTMT